MPALSKLDGSSVARVVSTYRDALRAHQEELNRLNVYPVPDGDTGTNMTLTLESVCKELGASTRMDDVCEAVAHGSLMGARGNSGVILSQILRGLADTFRDLDAVGARDLTEAFRTAADAAYQAVMRPVEGTILTVVRTTAEAAEAAGAAGEATLRGLLERVVSVARRRRPPDPRPAAGAQGGRASSTPAASASRCSSTRSSTVVDGRPLPEPQVVATPAVVAADQHGDETSSLRYEVMFLLEADDPTHPRRSRTRGARSATPSSSSAATGCGTATCTRTTSAPRSKPGSRRAGRRRSACTDLNEQVEEEQWVRASTADGNGLRPDGTARR